MLDLDHPMAKPIFHASRLMDRAMGCGQRMSVSPSADRQTLLQDCGPVFAEMRTLAADHFPDQRPFLLTAIDEFEAALRALAGLGEGRITEDRRDGDGTCPVCGTGITHVRPYRIVLCRECTRPFMRAYEKLDSDEGFGTEAI